MVVALSVVKARVRTDATGASVELPALLTPAGVLEPLLDYCLSRSHDRSLEWMRKVVRAVRLFVEYLSCNALERDNYRLFMNFAQRLYSGSFDRRTGTDPSGLGWTPMNARAARAVVSNLTEFFDYLAETRPAAAKLNPKYAGGVFDRGIDEAAYQHRRDRAFLGHTWATTASHESGTSGRRVRPARNVATERIQPPAFPEEHFARFMTEGFKVGKRYDYRAMLITLLLHGAGFRESEPFHLYTADVVPDPANHRSAVVLIHHPSEGAAPGDWRDERGSKKAGNRAAYLHEKWGLAPRHEQWGSKEAGWKGGAHEESFGSLFFRAYWFVPAYGELFMLIWYRYLEQLAMIDRSHPYAFVNTAREPLGSPYSINQYNKAHSAAVRRIGLQVSKAAGTTPHGHRHAYGRRLAAANVKPEFIRRFMHHSAVESQGTYTQPTPSEVLAALRSANQTLENSAALAHEAREISLQLQSIDQSQPKGQGK